ncbi:MAG: hypothetical protein ACYC69_01440 [Thermodesulfovibrionales bacterium]
MLRIRHTGGEKADKGNYWNFSTGDRVSLESEGMLPGDSSVSYYKANPVLILAAGPFLGLIYAAFLPFIGLAIVLKVALTKVFGRTADGMSRVSTFNWSPSEAYLAGRRRKKMKNDEAADKSSTASGEKKE